MARPVEADVVLARGEHLPAVDVWLVIDVLRATTVMVRWFELGGKELFPAGTVKEAREAAAAQALEGALLMGEENAIPPEGFDLGNSPLDLTRELVQAHPRAVMATTNGTAALLAAAATGVPVIAACVRNASAALDHALTLGRRLGILCSGRKQRPCWDDLLCAGLVLGGLRARHPDLVLADGARIALLAWEASPDLEASMRTADHAVFLERIGYGADIAFACQRDAASVVPMLDEEGGRATLRRVAGSALPYPAAPEPKPPVKPAEAPPPSVSPPPRYFFLSGERARPKKALNLEGLEPGEA